MGIGVWLAAALIGALCTFASPQPEDARYRVALIDEFYPVRLPPPCAVS